MDDDEGPPWFTVDILFGFAGGVGKLLEPSVLIFFDVSFTVVSVFLFGGRGGGPSGCFGSPFTVVSVVSVFKCAKCAGGGFPEDSSFFTDRTSWRWFDFLLGLLFCCFRWKWCWFFLRGDWHQFGFNSSLLCRLQHQVLAQHHQ